MASPSQATYFKPVRITLKDDERFDEAWVKDRILADPAVLGLGDLIVRDTERRQPRAGRLDLLLEDPAYLARYEVELMLGRVDESHIIRCIEYWDTERRARHSSRLRHENPGNRPDGPRPKRRGRKTRPRRPAGLVCRKRRH